MNTVINSNTNTTVNMNAIYNYSDEFKYNS